MAANPSGFPGYRPELQAALAGLAGDVAATTKLHTAMAVAVEGNVRDYVLLLDSRSPNTGYYAKASRSVESYSDEAAGTVRVVHTGMALRFYGGRVDMKDKLLALPTENVPVSGDERVRPGQMEGLIFRRAKADAKPNVRGYLLGNDKLMYVLCEWTDHAPDPTVIPTDAALLEAATDGAENYLAASIKKEGLA